VLILSRLPDILGVDAVVASIIVFKDEEHKEYKIHEPWDFRIKLASLKAGDVLNIKGIGRLRVMLSREYHTGDGFIDIVEYVIDCNWISDWWDNVTTSIVASFADSRRVAEERRIESIIKRDFERTWK
jgi:hypothetical protein